MIKTKDFGTFFYLVHKIMYQILMAENESKTAVLKYI